MDIQKFELINYDLFSVDAVQSIYHLDCSNIGFVGSKLSQSLDLCSALVLTCAHRGILMGCFTHLRTSIEHKKYS